MQKVEGTAHSKSTKKQRVDNETTEDTMLDSSTSQTQDVNATGEEHTDHAVEMQFNQWELP